MYWNPGAQYAGVRFRPVKAEAAMIPGRPELNADIGLSLQDCGLPGIRRRFPVDPRPPGEPRVHSATFSIRAVRIILKNGNQGIRHESGGRRFSRGKENRKPPASLWRDRYLKKYLAGDFRNPFFIRASLPLRTENPPRPLRNLAPLSIHPATVQV